jgi:7-carboxy-7-deazaguanine synthase
VTVSPKMSMAGGLEVLPKALSEASEIKMPVEGQPDIDNLLGLLEGREPRGPVWLQPVSQGDYATQLCVEACMKHRWRLSLQTHKYAGMR